MTQEYEVRVDGNIYTVTISDEEQALLAAKAAGRVVVGLLHGEERRNLSAAEYLVEELETADRQYLERVVRRNLGLPWMIAETERVIIREFTLEDIPWMMQAEAGLSGGMWEAGEKAGWEAYIRNQYCFYEYGLWAVVRKSDNVILGVAGVSDCDIGRIRGLDVKGTVNPADAVNTSRASANMQLELGYHIFESYQGQGYAVEACRTILDYIKKELDCPVYAVTYAANERSVRLLSKLDFELIEQRYNAEKQRLCLYGWNC